VTSPAVWADILSAMRRGGAIVIVVAAGAVADCTKTRAVIERPGLTVRVVDASGAPIAGASVVVSHWSLPHRKLHRAEVFTADAGGQIVTVREDGEETIAPLCMHGVPSHGYTVCAAGPNGLAAVNWNDGDATTIELRLDPSRDGRCEDVPERDAR
jgi:hypothetical protein